MTTKRVSDERLWLRAARRRSLCVCGHERRRHKGEPLGCTAPKKGKAKVCRCAEFRYAEEP